jgi:hypothetical protein
LFLAKSAKNTRLRGALLVFLASFLFSSWDIAHLGIAATYSDPIEHIRAQDEALYVNSAIRITQDGDWLTPKFMGRPLFLKPPLLMWLSALSIRMFGLSLMAVRLPALLFGAAGAAAVFVWIAQCRSILAGLFGAAILVMSPLWQTFSRLTYTDMLAGSCSALALVAVAFDPRLEKRVSAVWFGVFSGAAVLAKSLAGLLPVGALVLFLVISREKPRLARLSEIALSLLAIALPWHVYQGLVHPQWFWAEGIQFQLLGVGLKGMPTGDFRHSAFFYLQRLLQMDPVIALLGLVGVVGFLRVLFLWEHRKQTPELLAFCWVAVTMAALFAFQAKNLPYLVFLIPGLAILGASCGPRFLDRRPLVTVCLLVVIFAVKALSADRPWSLRPGAPPLEGAKAMRDYYDLHRDSELIDVRPDDEFYSATIPLPRVRYALVDPTGIVARTVPYYIPLGIVLTTKELLSLQNLLPGYQENLRKWGFDSVEPVGTTILMNAPEDLSELVRARPESDFYIPAEWSQTLQNYQPTHTLIPYSTDRVFLFSKKGQARTGVRPLPGRW